MSRMSNPDRYRWWQSLLARFNPQKHTVARFCRDNDISVASFYHWRKRLAATSSQPTTPRLIPVLLSGSPLPERTTATTPIVVRVGTHAVIEIAHAHAQTLTDIIVALAQQVQREELARQQPGGEQ